MKQTILYTLLFMVLSGGIEAQKTLLLERSNRARTGKYYVGDRLRFSLKGSEGYWYTRTITDILPESKALMLEEYLVPLDSIAAIKVRKGRAAGVVGGALLSFGATIPLALGAAVLYGDKDEPYGTWGAIAGGSLLGSYALLKPRKLKMGKKNRLRAIEIKFPEPLIAPPTFKN